MNRAGMAALRDAGRKVCGAAGEALSGDRSFPRPIAIAAIGAGAAVVVAAVLLGLAQPPRGENRFLSAAPPPDLWLGEVIDEQGAVRETFWVCADAVIRAGLARAVPEINGAPCRIIGQPVERADLFAARCLALGRRFSVNVSRSGDLNHDFKVRVHVRPLEAQHPGAAGSMRYRKLGRCPGTWRNGDSARG